MESIDLSLDSAWTAKFGGTEQYAVVLSDADSLLEGRDVTVMVVCDSQAFSQGDRDHALLRWKRLGQNLRPALGRMIRYLSLKDEREFLAWYGVPTVMLTAGDFENWSLSFERNIQPVSSIFCDWHNDEICDVWVAD
jgi:hypothetical protein